MLTRESLANGDFLKSVEASLPAGTRWTQDQITRSLNSTMEERHPGAPVWLFTYGSLIWNPLLLAEEAQWAVLGGWQRRFCIRLMSGRATGEFPGRMLALEPGGMTRGLAFRISDKNLEQELPLVWIREMVAGFYRPTWARIQLADGQAVRAITFVSDPKHPMYEADSLPVTVAPVIARAEGPIGRNSDYVWELHQRLTDNGIHDEYIALLVEALSDESDGRPLLER